MNALPIALNEKEGVGQFLIWIILGAFWLIGVVSEHLKKRSRAAAPPTTRPPQPRPEPLNSDELEKRFRQLLGLPEKQEQEEPLEPAPAPRASLSSPPPPLVREAIQFDGPPPLPHAVRLKKDVSQADGDAFAAVAEMEDIESLMEKPHAQNVNVVNPSQFLVNLSKLKIPLLRTPVMSLSSMRSSVTPPDLRKQSQLRDAVIGNILLGPPKGL